MADVTVNINGNASGLRNELNSIQSEYSEGVTPSPRIAPSPPSDRLIDEVRAEINSQRTISTKEAIEAIRNQERIKIEDDISSRYNSRRSDMQRRMSADYDIIDKNIEDKRKNTLVDVGANRANDPLYRKTLEQQLERERDIEYKRVGEKYDAEEQKINDEERSERGRAESELTSAIKELTEFFNRQKEQGEDSFVGSLRAKQKALIAERDSSPTEEGALDAGRRLTEVNQQLRNVLGGNQVQGKSYFDSMLQGSQGLTNMLGGAQSGDIGGTIMGAGGAIAGLSGMSMKAALKFLGIVGAIAAVGDLVKKTSTMGSQTSEGFAGLMSLRSTTPEGLNTLGYFTSSESLKKYNFGGKGYSDFGLSPEEFGSQAFGRSKARGTSEDWIAETFRQIGLERSLALSEGSLKEGSKFDRYGQNVTEAISKMVTLLSAVEGSGVSERDFSRVQEKYDIQQSIMNSYLERTDKPDFDTANKILAAFSSVKGITQDSRIGTDILSFQDAIKNPTNNRFKSMIYGTVSDLFPNLSGRPDLIERAINDPENDNKIIPAVVKRITAMWGGTETTMGYFATKQFLSGIAQPERRDAYMKAFGQEGETSRILKDGSLTKYGEEVTRTNMDTWTVESAKQFTEMNKFLKGIEATAKTIAARIISPNPNSPSTIAKRGGFN